MAAEPPTFEPRTFQAGDTLNFTKTLSDYPAGEGWALTYRLVSRAGQTPIDITSTADGDDFEVNVAAATTAGWDAGEYTLYGFVTLSPNRFQVYRSPFTITPDPATEDHIDSRTYLERILEKLEKVIEEGVIREVIRYSYNNVSTEVQTMKDAFDARDRIKAAIAQEAALASGRQQKILTRFLNAR